MLLFYLTGTTSSMFSAADAMKVMEYKHHTKYGVCNDGRCEDLKGH